MGVSTRETRRWRSPVHGHVSQVDVHRVFYGQLRRASLPVPFACKDGASISETAARIRKLSSPVARSRSLSEPPRSSSGRREGDEVVDLRARADAVASESR